MNPPARPNEVFRVPNSIVQSLTTTTDPALGGETGLNRLTAFQTVTLIGLMTLLNPRRPHAEVRTTPSQVLDIIQVSRNVAHAVDRAWSTEDGATTRKTYTARRRSPRYVTMIHEALLALHNHSVCLQRRDPKTRARLSDRVVHVLDSFGYDYHHNGKALDLHDLPQGYERINIGSEGRPVWRLRVVRDGDAQFHRPRRVCFRLNAELARELGNQVGTIGSTLFARKIFGLFRRYMRSPATIRLIILILRQTGEQFCRGLTQILVDLGFDITHPRRAMGELASALGELKGANLLTTYRVDQGADRLEMQVNRLWHQVEPARGGAS